MINFNAFSAAHQRFTKKSMPFLDELRNLAQDKKIYQGLTILHNIPLTIETVLKIEILLLGGAKVTASCIRSLPPNLEALGILKEANVDIQLDHHFKKNYDFHLDCCGELLDICPPNIGAIELTQTGSQLYKKANCLYPVLSVDDSPLKLLETMFGTGDGFLRALICKFGQDFYDKQFVLFGFGKVGQGIARSLMNFTKKIVVIDKNQASKHIALKYGFKYFTGLDKESIIPVLKDSAFVVSATGVKNLMSDFYAFNKADFHEAKLINMGAEDEYGPNFSEEDVVFDKKPFNFSISEPTAVKYLDPIFYAHNLGIELILSKKIKSGYHAFPENVAKEILKKWSVFHEEVLFESEEACLY